MGNKVEFIDIKPGRAIANNYYKKSFTFSKLRRILYYLFSYRRNNIFKGKQNEVLGCTHEKNFSSNYDLIVIGSDEVFNFDQSSSWGFATSLFGDLNAEHIISYAGSFGNSTLDKVEEYGIRDELQKYMKNLQEISVRDNNSFEVVKNLLPQKQITYNWDPVLIGTLPATHRPTTKNYLLVYAYDFRFNDEDYIQEIKKNSKE